MCIVTLKHFKHFILQRSPNRVFHEFLVYLVAINKGVTLIKGGVLQNGVQQSPTETIQVCRSTENYHAIPYLNFVQHYLYRT